MAAPDGLATRRRRGRQKVPFRYLLDSRLFRLLCSSGPAAPLDGFRRSLERHGLSPDGAFPDLEMTPLAILEVLGVEPPHYPGFPLPASWARDQKNYLITGAIVRMANDFFAKAPELQATHLRTRFDELKQKTDPAAHELVDLCFSRLLSREGFEKDIHGHLAFDFVYRFRFPEELREELFEFLAASLLGAVGESVSGVSKMRIVKTLWDRSYERLLKKNPGARREVQALDREMRLWSYKDFLDWEVVHHSILGYGAGERIHPVIAFAPDPEETLRARCSAYKSALRAFLDQIKRDELENELRPRLRAWRPGLVVPCREDGTFDTLVSTAELPVY